MTPPMRALALLPLLLLSGCIAAAAPLMGLVAVAGTAAGGFSLYKSVQTASGGSIRVSFASPDGKPTAPPPMPSVHRIAVWPGDEGDVHFAERLSGSGRYQVVAPAAVNAILAKASIPVDLKQSTEQERQEAFERVCRAARVDFVFAARDLGHSENANLFSFSRGTVTYKADLLGFECAKKTIVWRDQIALVVEVGGSLASESEMLRASSDAWADRVLGPAPAHNS